MGKRRTRIDIIGDILSALRQRDGRLKPTQLLYKANLSYQLLVEYLSELKEKGLVEEVVVGKKRERKEIVLTEKGFSFLHQYEQMKRFHESFGL